VHGLAKLSSLGWFTLYVSIPQFFYLFILVCLIRWGTKASFGFSLDAIKKLAKVAVPSGSSAATILTNVETARTFPIIEKYKNKGLIASILPFGATVNMDGTALFITIMCKIGADIQGIEVSFWQIIPYAVAYSCAAAAVPSASIVLITAIYSLLGIDPAITIKILGLMIAVDWINDRVRTLVNVSGDLAAILLTLNERSPLQLFMKSLRFSKSKLRMKNRATVKLSSNARDIA
jgi:Na+/H+-dicarboxylate symporter